MIIVFLGAPGTGKGTIASILKSEYGYEHISTGDLFRHHIKNESPLGLKVKTIIEGGNLVNDQITFELLKDKLDSLDLLSTKIILDGYPRTIHQDDLLVKYLEDKNIEYKKVVNFNVPKNIIIERLTERWICPTCGRIYNNKTLKPKNEGKCDSDNSNLIQRENNMMI